MARRVLSDTFRTRKRSISIDQIKKAVAESFDVKVELLSAKKKTQNVALARQVAMSLSRNLTQNSLKAIGEAFGGRDHSTVIHACNLIQRLTTEDPDFRQRLDLLTRNLNN